MGLGYHRKTVLGKDCEKRKWQQMITRGKGDIVEVTESRWRGGRER